MKVADMPKNLSEVIQELDKGDIKDYRRFSSVKRYLMLNAWENNIPISGTFEITPFCNFDCKMCYVHLSKEQVQRPLLSIKQWKNIMSQSVQNGMMFAEITGGECLSYEGFEELYCHLASLGVHVAVLTNGSLIEENTIRLFQRIAPSRVQITLYGSNEDIYENVTGTRSFHKVLQNIEALKARKIPLALTVTPNRYVFEDIEGMRELLEKLDLPYGVGNMLFPARANTGRILSDYDLSSEELVRLTRCFQNSSGSKVVYNAYPQMGIPFEKTERGVPCGAGRSGFAVNWQGELIPCLTFTPVAVDLLKTKFEDAWRAINRASLAYQQPSQCNSCGRKTRCKRCPAEIEKYTQYYGNITMMCDRVNALSNSEQ